MTRETPALGNPNWVNAENPNRKSQPITGFSSTAMRNPPHSGFNYFPLFAFANVTDLKQFQSKLMGTMLGRVDGPGLRIRRCGSWFTPAINSFCDLCHVMLHPWDSVSFSIKWEGWTSNPLWHWSYLFMASVSHQIQTKHLQSWDVAFSLLNPQTQ